jgi:hypothetical protein
VPTASPATSGKVSLQSSRGKSLGSRTFKCTKAGKKNVVVTFSSSNATTLRHHASNSVKTTISSQDATGESAANTLRITILGH